MPLNDNWLEQGPIGEYQRPTEVPKRTEPDAPMLSHQATSDDVVRTVNGLSQAKRQEWRRLQPEICPPGYRWSLAHRLVRNA